MKNEDRKSLHRYTRLVVSAVKSGVSLDDLMDETARYHGSDFRDNILQRVRMILS